MHTERRRARTRDKKRLYKKRLAYVVIAIAVCALAAFVVYSTLGPKGPAIVDYTPRAAIVDHLSLQWPNEAFVQTIKSILNETDLKVDYFPAQAVTVDFYRKLPSRNYRIIVFRVHSTAECAIEGQPPYVIFFTSETYTNSQHVPEQLDMRLVYVNFPNSEGQPGYFGITPLFIENSMEGRLNDTVIISMGCDGLREDTMAEAFREKGAKAYISWNGSVSASHTDQATECLLRHLITENRTIMEAVSHTMDEVGSDRAYESILEFYPENVGPLFFLARTTNDTATVEMAIENDKRNEENSGTAVVPTILTWCSPCP